MSGVMVINHLLSSYPALTAQVPATRIITGTIPQKTALPAIGVVEIDANPRHTVSQRETKVLKTERVQVTAQTKTYASKKLLLNLTLDACQNTHGTVSGVDVDSILEDTRGPDLDDSDAQIYTQSQDFLVRWRRTR